MSVARSRSTTRQQSTPQVSGEPTCGELTGCGLSPAIELNRARPHTAAMAPLLDPPEPQGHAVQFYEDDAFLCETVAEYLAAGLRGGERLIVIATPAHSAAFTARLVPARVRAAVESGALTWLDAETTLNAFMIDGLPNRAAFFALLQRLLGSPGAIQTRPRRGVRAYGEMVDVLWRRGQPEAAIALEELWSEATKLYELSLLCAYRMDNFARDYDSVGFLDVCKAHNHVIPNEHFCRLGNEESRQREISRLQQRAAVLEAEIAQRKELEQALLEALQLRASSEKELRASIEREREARQRAEASDAFKQLFLGMLGHDLRNPLSTILTTTQMMILRRELPVESHKRLARVVSSAERMRRMIEQILDVTRAKLSAGIPVRRTQRLDLLARVFKIVEEVRSAHPTRQIVFEPELPCLAQVDGDRFEQVVCNLLGNAIAHGDPSRPITVTMERPDDSIRLRVHNHGQAIDPQFLPLLFDPFERGGTPMGRSDGLGLGLYISKCIIEAHGGRIDVESAVDSGTRFEVTLPGN